MTRSLTLGILITTLSTLGFTTGCATHSHHLASGGQRQLAAKDDDGSLRIIDAHTHSSAMGDYQETKPEKIREDYLANRREAGVVASIDHTSDLDKGYLEYDKKENVTFCAGIRPPVKTAQLEAGLKSGKFKCMKIYLGYTPKFADDPAYDPVYKLAEKYHVPVVFHTGDVLNKNARVKFADPMLIDDVAVKYRKVNFVIAHCGNPWIETAAELAYKNDNVYLDGSAFLTGDLNKEPKEKVEEYVVKPLRWIFGYVENPKKLMFGTDYPLTRTSSYVEPFKRAIPKEHWKAVFHDNAVRVFNIQGE